MSVPTVAVITRTRNRPLFLERALRSVSSQTDHDYVHVIINDGGNLDDVCNAVRKLHDEDAKRILIVDNQAPEGREAAVNVGLDAQESKYFAIHDDDDWWEPEFLARTVDYLDSNAEHVAVFTRCDVVREHIQDGILVEDERELLAADLHSATLIDTLVVNANPPIAELIRREVADSVGHWDGSLAVQADWEFTIRLMMAGPVGFIDGDPLAHWSHRLIVGGDSANSVVAEKQRHLDANLEIRDRYLRQGASDSSSMALAQSLVSAEYFRRIDSRIQEFTTDYHRTQGSSKSSDAAHLESVYVSLVKLIDEQNRRIDELHSQNSKLSEQIAEVLRSRHPLARFASSTAHRIRELLRSNPVATRD